MVVNNGLIVTELIFFLLNTWNKTYLTASSFILFARSYRPDNKTGLQTCVTLLFLLLLE